MSTKIFIRPIAFDDAKQKANVQYTTNITLMKDGKEVYPDEVTGFMFHEYSGFAPAKFFAPEKRDFIKIPINEEEQSCVDFMNTVEKYDKALKDQMDSVFGKFAKLYTRGSSIKEPKEKDELEMEGNDDKPKKPETKSIKLRLRTGWRYYYDDVALDVANTQTIRKAVSDHLSKSGDKKGIDDLIVELSFKDGDKQIKKKLKMSEIESRKEIMTKVYYRKVENLSADAKKVHECADNDELEKFYGKPEEVDVKTGEDLDKYYRYNCYVRFLYGPAKVWAAKSKDENGKRKTGIQFVCHQIDIINVRTNSTSSSTARSIYSGYGFGSRTQGEVKSSSNNDEPDNKASKASAKPARDEKKATKSLKVESESESESEDEKSEDEKSESESESESDESESEDEPEPPKKGAKGKAVVEKSKAPVKRK